MRYYCHMCMKSKTQGPMYSRSADFEKHIKSKQHLFIVHQMVNVAKMKQTMLDLLVYTEQDFDVVGDLKEDGTFNSKIMTTKTGIDISQYKDPFSKFYNENSVPSYEESEEMEATKVI